MWNFAALKINRLNFIINVEIKNNGQYKYWIFSAKKRAHKKPLVTKGLNYE